MTAGTGETRRRGLRYAQALLGTAWTIALVLAFPSGAGAVKLARIGRAPQLPAGTAPLAAVASDRRMQVTLALEPRDPAGLAAYAAAVSNPASPAYRRFLTVAEFAKRFGARAGRVAALEASLRAHGLHPGRLSANGLSISLAARAGQLERGFSIALNAVRLPDGQAEVLSAQTPALDASVAGTVQAVVGLSSQNHLSSGLLSSRAAGSTLPASAARALPASTARAAPRIATGGPQPCRAAAGAAPGQSAYTADQIASAYDVSPLYQAGDEGAGVTVAVYELEPVDLHDLAIYQRCYGTNTQISFVQVDGGVRPGPGSGEAALDIEQLIGLVPQARLLVYQAPNSNSNQPGAGPYDEFSAIVSQDAAQVITNSWGQCEPQEGQQDAAAENVLFEEAAAQGQTFVSSSGDSGSEDCDYGARANGNTSLQVDDPASQPFVTGVGGTTLSSLGPPAAETAWNSAGQVAGLLGLPGAGGGGISHFWPMPSYQAGAPAALGVIGSLSSALPCHTASGVCREVPDVSANADPEHGYLIYYNGAGDRSAAPSGWQGTGGTSAAAPVWAAVMALADADPACGNHPIGFANPALYRLAALAQATYFHPVTSGNNDLTGTAKGLYPAGSGYSMAAGLGSPVAGALAPALCASSLRLGAPRSELTQVRIRASARLRAVAPAGMKVTYAGHGLPRGLALDPATGRITGAATVPGRHHVRIRVTDTAGDVRVARFTWTVYGHPRVFGVTLNTAVPGLLWLELTVSAGRFGPPVRLIQVRLPRGLRLAHDLASVVVQDRSGGSLRHSARTSHGMLSIALPVPEARVRIVLGPGTLVAAGGHLPLISVRRPAPLRVTVVTVRPPGHARGQAETLVAPVGKPS